MSGNVAAAARSVIDPCDGLIATLPPPTYPLSRTYEKPTWRVALDHRFTDDILGYVSYNRGFKSGGYNTHSADNPPYNPETLDAYEIGAKTEWLAHQVLSGEYDSLPAVVCDFPESRSGLHASTFLGSWSGRLILVRCSRSSI
ncbi:MAG: hypothetical protein JWM63_4938 [Gammaproteobacteria bacterium]|nr:hypothetical protein [Gammaproteobacteria bacterium]